MTVPEVSPLDERSHTSAARLVAVVRWRLYNLAAMSYIGAASLVGFETLALILGFATAWPVAIPIAVAVLAAAYYLLQPTRSLLLRLRR